MTAATVARRAWLSPCGSYRWTLERSWASGKGHVLFIGLNPSTADHQVDDPTVRRWMHFASYWGFGGFVAVNLYPYRSSNPAELRRWANWEANGPDWYARDAMQDNVSVIRTEAARASLIVPCWGAIAWDEGWMEYVVEEIFCSTNLAEIHCLGETASGAPMHPMARGQHRIPDDRQPILWRSL